MTTQPPLRLYLIEPVIDICENFAVTDEHAGYLNRGIVRPAQLAGRILQEKGLRRVAKNNRATKGRPRTSSDFVVRRWVASAAASSVEFVGREPLLAAALPVAPAPRARAPSSRIARAAAFRFVQNASSNSR